MNNSSPNIIFGLAEHPRPRNSGYFYYKPSTMFADFQIKTLAILDLFITDEKYLTDIIKKGINRLLEEKKYKDNMEYYLTNYETENMKPFVIDILRQVIDSRLKNINKSSLPPI
ncbi:hypothetical protein [Desulfobacula toluolica]|uniref:hypothetical protein n=1 Tax=Desulfobacula toluolica TaxID=28223 RepID=UPI0011D24F38|nr:hypothetical protein [Desulfobacula toluolica]